MIQYENLKGERTLCSTSDALSRYLCVEANVLDNVTKYLIRNGTIDLDGFYTIPYTVVSRNYRPFCKKGQVITNYTILDESSTYKVIIAAWDVRVVQRPHETLNSIIIEVAKEFKRIRANDKYEGVNNGIS